jgi:hypothetical protein
MSKTYTYTYNLDGQVVTSPKVYPTLRGAKIALKRLSNQLVKQGKAVTNQSVNQNG